MKRSLLLSLAIVAAVGCGGSSSNGTTSRFPGQYTGTWVSLDNAADAGTAQWTVAADGTVTGQDFDPGRDTTFNIAGRIDANGNLTSQSTPTGGAPSSLNGRLGYNGNNELTGILTWGVEPALSYRYTFTRQND